MFQGSTYNGVQEWGPLLSSSRSLQTRSRVNGILFISGYRVAFFATTQKAWLWISKSHSFSGLLSHLPPTSLGLEFDTWGGTTNQLQESWGLILRARTVGPRGPGAYWTGLTISKLNTFFFPLWSLSKALFKFWHWLLCPESWGFLSLPSNDLHQQWKSRSSHHLAVTHKLAKNSCYKSLPRHPELVAWDLLSWILSHLARWTDARVPTAPVQRLTTSLLALMK